MTNTQTRMIEDGGKLRPRKVRCVLTVSMGMKAVGVMKDKVYCVDTANNVWKYVEGWDDTRVAMTIGAPGHVSGVARVRQKEFGVLHTPSKLMKPAVEDESTKATLAKIMKRLDKIEATIEELAKAFR